MPIPRCSAKEFVTHRVDKREKWGKFFGCDTGLYLLE